jgi:hypothetical protein
MLTEEGEEVFFMNITPVVSKGIQNIRHVQE